MSFEHYKFLPLVILIFVVFAFLVVKTYGHYNKTVEKYWFFVPSLFQKYRLQTFLLAILIMLVATLDLRGPEERIKASIPDQKTIIIIDSSASMLAEDVKPNRFKRALFLARHFIKRAAGHQIAVVLFSDTQKRLVPFTDDIDLLDARVAALENINLANGNSNINQAVKESLQYFKIDNDSEKIVGNILLFTDSEEHGGNFPLKEGLDVNMAVVGVGTAAGAPIPLRSKSGVFLNYKTHKGEKVTTKLNESAIKSMGKDFKNFKYWIATSYIIPTDDILQFFRGIYKKKLGETDIRIRPVFGHYIVILGVLIYFLSSLLGIGKSFQKPLALILLFLSVGSFNDLQANAEAPIESGKGKEVKDTPVVLKRKQNLKSGIATSNEKKFLAQEFLKTGKAKEASTLYEEINSTQAKDINSLVNMGTAYASSGNLKMALDSYENAVQIMPEGQSKEELKNALRSNVLVAIKKQKQKKKDQKKKKDEKNKDKKKKKEGKKDKDKDKKDQSGKGSSGDKKGKDQEKNKSSEQKKKEQQDKEKQKEEKKQKEKKKGEESKKAEQQQQQAPSTLEQKEKDIKKKRKLVKIPAMLKQIMDQDRNLQEQYYRTNQKRKRNNNEAKDW